MTSRRQNLPEFLQSCFAHVDQLPASQVDEACDRVLGVLRQVGQAGHVGHSPARDSSVSLSRHAPRARHRRRIALVAVVAALVIAMFISRTRESPDLAVAGRVPAVVQTAEGFFDPLADGEVFRTDDKGGALLRLADSSRIEVREESELSVARAAGDFRIQLSRGTVIVNAIRGPARKVYVETKDLTAAATESVFLVSAEMDGSRVAVIQGEVHVHQAAAEMDLIQGGLLTTNSAMESRSAAEEIAWSRYDRIHLQQLQRRAMSTEELCGPMDLRTLVHENGGWSLRLPGVLWKRFKCSREGDGS
jgi:ferric-dicitrate binding protein FerR (iron transport regulator)